MPKITFPATFDRRFELCSVEATHSVLILRSNSSTKSPTRIDNMFSAVREIRLRWVVPDLSVDLLRDGDPRIAELGIRPEPYSHVFALSSSDLAVGYVIACAMFTSEDDLAPSQPSTLDELHPELKSHIIRSGYFNDRPADVGAVRISRPGSAAS
jgi:hypothetical protein